MYLEKVYLEALGEEPIDTKTVAKRVGCSYDTALKNLVRLRGLGKIDGKKLNGTQWIWGKKK